VLPLEDSLISLIAGAAAKLGYPATPVVLRRIAPPREWGYATTLPQELAAEALAGEQARLEAEMGKKAAKKALQERSRALAGEIAQKLAAEVTASLPAQASRAAAEGGYLNFYIDAPSAAGGIVATVLEQRADYGRGEAKGERVMVEFSQPNTHKEFHVGHLRNVLLGNAIANLYAFAGYEVLRANYYGDHGIHVAKALWGRMHAGLLAEAEGLMGGATGASVYARVERLLTCEGGTARLGEIKAQAETGIPQILRDLDDTKSAAFAMWRATRSEDLEEFARIYGELGVHFDIEFFESEAEGMTAAIVDELLAKGVAEIATEGEYAGTAVVDFARFGAPELGKMVIRRSDGTTLYQTKELALAQVKFRNHKADRSLYVVGSEQSLYFKQVFAILRAWGFAAAAKCRHISYELVQLAGGKMSSREGTVIVYNAFINEAKAKALELSQERGISADTEKVAGIVALGAVKYAFLKVDPSKTIVFDWEQALSFDGNAGPYIQYAYARARKLLAGWEGASALGAGYVPAAEEIMLCRVLAEFPERAQQAQEACAPNLIANYLYELTRAFTDFYQACPVLKAEEGARRYRQGLVKAFSIVLETGCGLLGIELPEEM
jgi:arginyl-tRNA synthetase